MKRLLSVLLLIPAVVLGQYFFSQVQTATAPLQEAAGGGGYLIEENFEGVGLPAGFTAVSGTTDFDSTEVVLQGTESAMMTNFTSILATNIADLPEVYCYFKAQLHDPPDAVYNLLYYETEASSLLARVQHRNTSGSFRMYLGAANVSLPGSTDPGITYHFWTYYRASNSVGSLDAESWVAYTTNGILPITMTPGGNGSTNGGNWGWAIGGTNQISVANIGFECGGGGDSNIIDRFLVSTSAIGDNP